MNNYELSEKLEGMGQIVGMKKCESDQIRKTGTETGPTVVHCHLIVHNDKISKCMSVH